jgi:hypothetical protein
MELQKTHQILYHSLIDFMVMQHLVSVFKRLSKEEIIENGGPKYGNRRLFLLEGRFGEPLEDGDNILMNFNGKQCKITEIGTKFNLLRKKEISTGFEVEDDNSREDSREH